MSKRNSIILGLLFVILVVEIIVLAPKELGTSPAEDIPAPVNESTEAYSGQIMRDVNLVEASADGKEWELRADRAIRPKENENWTIEKVRVKFYASDGVTYTVTGLKGHVVPLKNDIKIEGNVVTRSSNGYVFKTESVFYQSSKRTLVSPEEVEMIGSKDKEGGILTLKGADLRADFASNEINIGRGVRARKTFSGDRVTTIQSQRATFSGVSNSARFFGNVIIDVESMRISGTEARLSYNPTTQALESVFVDGGIRVTDTDKFATSRSVSLHFKEDRVVFNGAPRVVQNGDEIVGDEIVFLDGGRRVKVSNARAQIDPKTVEKKN